MNLIIVHAPRVAPASEAMHWPRDDRLGSRDFVTPVSICSNLTLEVLLALREDAGVKPLIGSPCIPKRRRVQQPAVGVLSPSLPVPGFAHEDWFSPVGRETPSQRRDSDCTTS